MPRSTVRLLPLSPAPFSVHLLLRETPAGPTDVDPFVRLGGEPGGDRAYLGVLVASGGAEVQRVVLKLPPPGPTTDDEGTPLDGLSLEARWAAAHRDLARLQASPRYFPTLLLPPTEGGPEAPSLLPPTVFCTVHRQFFHIPCPRCFAPMRTCRDDTVLAQHGLPLYSLSPTRLLTCPSCREAGESERFFAASRAEAAELAARGVADLAVLRRELTAALERALRDGAPLPSPASFPCSSGGDPCSCLGLPDGEKGKSRTQVGEAAWMPFIPHDAPYLLLAHAPVSFDSFVDLLGGKLPQDPGGTAPRPAGAGFLCHQAESSGVDAVEIFALKTVLFLQVACGLREYHRLVGLPHLDLHPGHLVVEPGAAGDHLPRLWSFQAKLLGTSSRRQRTLSEGVSVALPPRDPSMTYLTPALRASYLIRPRTAELVLDRLVPAKGVKDAWHIEGRLADPQGIFPRPGPHDPIALRWSHDLFGARAHATVARADPRDAGGRPLEIAITSDPVPMEPMAAHHLERAAGLRIPDVTYRCYPAFGPREDLHALGIVLLRTLVVNDQQGLEAIEGLVSTMQHRDGGARRLRGAPGGEDVLAWALREHDQALAKANVFHRALDRDPRRPNAIPDDLWATALGIALELVSGAYGQSGGAAERLPSAALDRAIQSGEALLRRLHVILFGRQPVNVEIRSVLAEALTSLGPPRS